MREPSMKTVDEQNDEMRQEYKREDLGAGVRGKYYDAYNEGHNLVLLTPEVARAFPSEEAVNQALLSLMRIAQASTGSISGELAEGARR
uniref:Uncharacterized protein n=1 Tax=Candidatus Kentrum eta TaxID=2126337 RepID=A0A450V3P0_9GAMM|nr:MAG: hypothetical protein BECKH772A_GA0070896_101619 [Candidatus Kentron sp. H]VFJ99734.1 MAG: hypothetical protein BECKH772B_GA0070898_101677 [Candidatus Kentron sp. H]VFK04015.1 MAG: hypothetical protein BECKH772C_GA0070978_101578 [Candidatus Kentron sp. H]